MDPTTVSLVTGANRGLGLEFVRQLLARGARVVATCRQPGKATALNGLAGEHPGRLYVLPLDVASEKSRNELVRELPLLGEDPARPPRIELLVNNAGVLHSGERFGSVPAANLDDSLRTNAVGPFQLVQALARWLADGGKVANISSEMGSIASRDAFQSPSYCIGKAAQNMATVQLARALAPRGIAVVALHPGWVRTAMGGDQARLDAEESVTGLLQVIDGLAPADSGHFVDWRGATMPW